MNAMIKVPLCSVDEMSASLQQKEKKKETVKNIIKDIQ